MARNWFNTKAPDHMEGTSWKGMDSEDQMNSKDWAKRDFERTQHQEVNAGWHPDPEAYSPDEDGVGTGGCYNGDYTESAHEAAWDALKDEYQEAATEKDSRTLFNWFNR